MAINRRGNLTGKNNESHNLSEVSLFLFKSFHIRRLQKQSFLRNPRWLSHFYFYLYLHVRFSVVIYILFCVLILIFICIFLGFRSHDTHIDFLRLLFLVGMICPLIQEHFLRPLLKRKSLPLRLNKSFRLFSLLQSAPWI